MVAFLNRKDSADEVRTSITAEYAQDPRDVADICPDVERPWEWFGHFVCGIMAGCWETLEGRRDGKGCIKFSPIRLCLILNRPITTTCSDMDFVEFTSLIDEATEDVEFSRFPRTFWSLDHL